MLAGKYNFYVEILELLFLLPRPLIIRFSIFRIEIIVLDNYSILMYVTFSTPCTSIFFPSSSSTLLRIVSDSTDDFLNNLSTAFPYIFIFNANFPEKGESSNWWPINETIPVASRRPKIFETSCRPNDKNFVFVELGQGE